MLSLLSINAFSFSLKETIKISKLKSTIKIWMLITIEPNDLIKKDNTIIIKVDLKKTLYLKTAIIENE